MKNFIGSIMILFICSCNVENDDIKLKSLVGDRINATDGTLVEKSAFKEFHLKRLASWYHLNEKNPDLKAFIASVPADEGEKTIRIQDMVKAIGAENSLTADEKSSLNAFTDLDGDDWTPTLTFLQVSNSSKRVRQETEMTDLYFFPPVETEIPQELFEAFYFPPFTFTLNLWDANFSSLDAINFNILVFDLETNSNFPWNFVSANLASDKRIIIDKMTLKDLKERWINGKADVSIVGFSS